MIVISSSLPDEWCRMRHKTRLGDLLSPHFGSNHPNTHLGPEVASRTTHLTLMMIAVRDRVFMLFSSSARLKSQRLLDARSLAQHWRLSLKRGSAFPLIDRASANYILCVLPFDPLADTHVNLRCGQIYYSITVYCQSLPAESCRYWPDRELHRANRGITAQIHWHCAKWSFFFFWLYKVQRE